VIDKQVLDSGSPEQTRASADPRIRQFIRGDAKGPLTAIG
jgi:ABC-type transporter Mla maintaining outer membrane lipid asymmetry ATPase subunit MlaF